MFWILLTSPHRHEGTSRPILTYVSTGTLKLHTWTHEELATPGWLGQIHVCNGRNRVRHTTLPRNSIHPMLNKDRQTEP